MKSILMSVQVIFEKQGIFSLQLINKPISTVREHSQIYVTFSL